MSTRKKIFSQEEYYHLYNRGNSKRIIFHDNEDMDRFLSLLFISNNTSRFTIRSITKEQHTPIYTVRRDKKLVAIGAYCLMPNHFHILITQISDNGISKFMQKLSTAYSTYYNKKYSHTGGLFEGKFKSKHISTDRYMKYIFSYIHLNPVKLIEPLWKEKGIKGLSKARAYLHTYTHSSYLDFLHAGNTSLTREESSILDLEAFPKYFPSKSTFEGEIVRWLSFKDSVNIEN